jgi:glutathione S-transferase
MNERPVLAIGNKNYSSWSLRPWLLLRHFGVGFDEVRVPLGTPDFAADIAAWSPSGRVPALRHGTLTIWDSLAICEYVDETFLDRAGWPADRAARAVARAVSAEMHSGFQALRERMPMNCRRRATGFVPGAEAMSDIARIFDMWRDCRARFGDAGAFLFRDFSIADAMYAPVLLRLRSYGVPLDADLRGYADAVLGLTAMQEWLAAAESESESLPATDEVV